MEKFILVTILPVFVAFTTFLFNIAIKEMVEFRYGLNQNEFKLIGILACLAYGLGVFVVIVLNSGGGIIPDIAESLALWLSVVIIVLFIIYLYLHARFKKTIEKILKESNVYKPGKARKYKEGSFVIIVISAILVFGFAYKFIQGMMEVKSIDGINSISLLIAYLLSLCYVLTILVSGYTYSYGQLLDFKKYRLIFELELKEIFDEPRIKMSGKSMDVYILAETKENMMIKVDGISYPAITIKKEHIRSISFMDEVKPYDRSSIRNLNSGKKGGSGMKKSKGKALKEISINTALMIILPVFILVIFLALGIMAKSTENMTGIPATSWLAFIGVLIGQAVAFLIRTYEKVAERKEEKEQNIKMTESIISNFLSKEINDNLKLIPISGIKKKLKELQAGSEHRQYGLGITQFKFKEYDKVKYEIIKYNNQATLEILEIYNLFYFLIDKEDLKNMDIEEIERIVNMYNEYTEKYIVKI